MTDLDILRSIREPLLKAIDRIFARQSYRLYEARDAGVDPSGYSRVPGQIHKDDIERLGRMGTDILTAGLVSTGLVRGVRFTVIPTPISLGGGNWMVMYRTEILDFVEVAA